MAINPGDTLNIAVSTAMTWGSFSLFGFARLTMTIIITMAKNVMVILSKKGKSGKAPLVQSGRFFKIVDIGTVSNAPASPAPAVVFFQNIPNKKNGKYAR